MFRLRVISRASALLTCRAAVRAGFAIAPITLGAFAAFAAFACHSSNAPRAQGVNAQAQTFRVEGIANWRGDATAAYTIIHDDVCDHGALGVFSAADPELTARGLHAGFGVIAGACDGAPKEGENHLKPGEKNGTWAQVKTLVAHGHDVFSHSFDHPCMTNDKALAESCDPKAPHSVDFAKEIGNAGALLTANTGHPQTFFIFPYDVCDPAAIAYLKTNGYLAARCGGPGTNETVLADPFGINFDVFGPSYSKYFAVDACAKTADGRAPVQYTTTPAEYTDACRLYVLNHYVDESIAAHGWGVREFHGLTPIDKDGWEAVSVADYRAHLDYIVAKGQSGALWVEGPSPILAYQRARDPHRCAAPTITSTGSGAGATLHFPPQSTQPDCANDGTLVSYRIATTDGSDVPNLRIKQGDRELPAKRISAGHFVVDAAPSRGDAVLIR